MSTNEEAKFFLDSIVSEDKVALVFHDDFDGFASGVLLYDFITKKGVKDMGTFPSHLSDKLFTDILPSLKKFDKIIIADISPYHVKDYLGELKDKKILYIDHHQKDSDISDFILEYRAPADKYFPASKMIFELVGGKEWVGVGGTMADVGYKYPENTEFINNFLEKNKISLEDYQKKVIYPIADLLVYFTDNLNKAFEIIKEVKSWENLGEINKYAEEVEKEIKSVLEDFEKNKEVINGILFYYFKPKFRIKSIIATTLGLKYEDQMSVTATQTEDDPEKIHISGRCQNGKMKMPEILKFAINNLENASVGGHLRAMGGFIQAKDLEKFKENLKNYKIS